MFMCEIASFGMHDASLNQEVLFIILYIEDNLNIVLTVSLTYPRAVKVQSLQREIAITKTQRTVADARVISFKMITT